MRILIAITCAAVLAAVAYYFVKEYRTATAQAEFARTRSACQYFRDAPDQKTGREVMHDKCQSIGINW